MKDLNKLFNECKTELHEIGINIPSCVTIETNGRLTRALGRCISYKYSENARIQIAPRVLADDVPMKSAKEIIIHECLHAVAPFGTHHGGEWAWMATKVNNCTNYKIERCADIDEMGIAPIEKKKKMATIKCEKCGKEITLSARTKIARMPDHFIHKGCGGELKLVGFSYKITT